MKLKTSRIWALSRLLLIVILTLQSAMRPLAAQDSASTDKKWHFRVEPYLLIPNMSGQTGVSGLPLADIDASSGDIFSSLKMGAMLYLEVTNGKWTIASDFLYMNLEQDLKTTNLINSGKVNAKQMAWELAGLLRMNNWLELGVGGMLNALEVDMEINIDPLGGSPETISRSKSKTWVDPMLIARLSTPGGVKKFVGQFRGEVGGFGVGSDFAWQVQAIAGYRFSKLFDITAGYRAISLDYSSGDGNSAFIYDIVTHGPVIRFGFNI